jgi:hypothetical protein
MVHVCLRISTLIASSKVVADNLLLGLLDRIDWHAR